MFCKKKKSKNDVVCDLHVGKKNPKKRGELRFAPLFFLRKFFLKLFKKVFFEVFFEREEVGSR